MRISMVFICLTLLTGCFASYNQNTLMEPSSKLVKGKAVLISTPANGFYDSKEYQNSGKMTADAVRVAFARYASPATISPEYIYISFQDRNQDYVYYAVPEILHWEDRATEWSGIPDRIEVKITIYDANRKEIASVIISGKSKWSTFGGDHPQDLLHDPINKYVESLY